MAAVIMNADPYSTDWRVEQQAVKYLVSQTEHHSLHQRTRGMSDEIYRTP